MSRKRRRQISVQTPQTQPDARRQEAARAVKALRSAEAIKLRQNVIHRFTQEVLHDVYPEVRKPPRLSPHKSVSPSIPQRRVPNNHELRHARLQPKVRHELQDTIRGLACYSRTARKEVLFAMRKTGKAGRRNRKARWTEKSYMRCK